MRVQQPLGPALTLLSPVVACGEEESHEHDAGEFASLAECQAHSEEEGHDAAEISTWCEGLDSP
jgi:hypothetical protein